MSSRCRHFRIQELVPRAVFEKYGPASWWFLDPRLCNLLDFLRSRYGKAWVNNWEAGQEQRGLRTEGGISSAGVRSFHFQGMGADVTFPGTPAEEVREDLLRLYGPDGTPGPNPICAFLRGLEDKVNWVHVDVRNSDRLIRFSKG